MYFVLLASAACGKLRVGFGSCLHQERRSRALESAARQALDLFIFLGDNGYHDTPACGAPWATETCGISEWVRTIRSFMVSDKRRHDYDMLWRNHVGPLREALPSMPIVATWDDHDLGQDDAGSDYIHKNSSLTSFLAFWRRPILELDLHRPTAHVYASYELGNVQVLVLDTRSYRTPLFPQSPLSAKLFGLFRLWWSQNETCDAGGYEQHAGTILGDDQWCWLERELAKPFDVRLVVSSFQVLRPHDGSECWANAPQERSRLVDLIKGTTGRTVILSGDVHYAEMSQYDNIVESTSSGLTESWPCVHANKFRVPNSTVRGNNFGVLEVRDNNSLSLQLRHADGSLAFEHLVLLDEDQCTA